MLASEALRLSESNLDVLFEVIKKAASDGYTGIELSKSDNKHYFVSVRTLYILVEDNQKYLRFLGYTIKKSLFGNTKSIHWSK